MKRKKENTGARKSKAPLIISVLLIAALVAAYFLIPEVQDFLNKAWKVLISGDEKRLEEWVSGFGWMGPAILILAMVAQMFLLFIPSVALMVVSILAYGPIFGSLIVFGAVFSASTVGYFIGRYFGPVIIQRIIGRKSEHKIEDFLKDYGFWAVIVTRLNPFLSNDAISFVAGILNMGYWRFIGATLLGIAPLTFFIAFIGKSTDGLKYGLLWGSLISLVLLGLYIWWDKRKR